MHRYIHHTGLRACIDTYIHTIHAYTYEYTHSHTQTYIHTYVPMHMHTKLHICRHNTRRPIHAHMHAGAPESLENCTQTPLTPQSLSSARIRTLTMTQSHSCRQKMFLVVSYY